jgi:hypothetical protein
MNTKKVLIKLVLACGIVVIGVGVWHVTKYVWEKNAETTVLGGCITSFEDEKVVTRDQLREIAKEYVLSEPFPFARLIISPEESLDTDGVLRFYVEWLIAYMAHKEDVFGAPKTFYVPKACSDVSEYFIGRTAVPGVYIGTLFEDDMGVTFSVLAQNRVFCNVPEKIVFHARFSKQYWREVTPQVEDVCVACPEACTAPFSPENTFWGE